MITRVRLVTPKGMDPARALPLTVAFPSCDLVFATAPSSASVAVLDAADWDWAAEDFAPFDGVMLRLGAPEPQEIAIRASTPGRVVPTTWEILTRYQRFVGRRNLHSQNMEFDGVLHEHALLHESEKPLVQDDLDHALDTWQWLLRLEPRASAALQMAALFHDIGRLISECDVRTEQRAPDYQGFNEARSRRGAALTRALLEHARVEPATTAKAFSLVESYERRGSEPEVSLLNDADALSFFSLNSPGYLDHFGIEQARRKLRYALGRLDRGRHGLLARVRLRRDVASLVHQELAQTEPHARATQHGP